MAERSWDRAIALHEESYELYMKASEAAEHGGAIKHYQTTGWL